MLTLHERLVLAGLGLSVFALAIPASFGLAWYAHEVPDHSLLEFLVGVSAIAVFLIGGFATYFLLAMASSLKKIRE